MNYILENMSNSHFKEVIDIFNFYIENSFAAYLSNKLPYEFYPKLLEMSSGFPAYIIKDETEQKIIGFCLLKPYSPLPAFSKTAEITYFLDKNYTNKGLGYLALSKLENDAKNIGIKNILASISSKNEQSLSFHEKNGFNYC